MPSGLHNYIVVSWHLYAGIPCCPYQIRLKWGDARMPTPNELDRETVDILQHCFTHHYRNNVGRDIIIAYRCFIYCRRMQIQHRILHHSGSMAFAPRLYVPAHSSERGRYVTGSRDHACHVTERSPAQDDRCSSVRQVDDGRRQQVSDVAVRHAAQQRNTGRLSSSLYRVVVVLMSSFV